MADLNGSFTPGTANSADLHSSLGILANVPLLANQGYLAHRKVRSKDKDNGESYAGPTTEFVLLSSTGGSGRNRTNPCSPCSPGFKENKNELTNIPDGTLPQPGVLHFSPRGNMAPF